MFPLCNIEIYSTISPPQSCIPYFVSVDTDPVFHSVVSSAIFTGKLKNSYFFRISCQTLVLSLPLILGTSIFQKIISRIGFSIFSFYLVPLIQFN